MPTGAWRYRRPLPVPPGMVRVQPIGDATPTEVVAYRVGRDAVGLANAVAARSARTAHVTSVTKEELGDWQP